MTVVYNPAQRYKIKVWDVEYRRDSIRTLMACIYQPQGAGPFPVLLDVHSGAGIPFLRPTHSRSSRTARSTSRAFRALSTAGFFSRVRRRTGPSR